MGFIEEFLPFYDKGKRRRKKPKYDVERALDVRLLPHPSLEQHRAANGELVLVIQRQLHPVEGFISRFLKVDRRRHIVLEKHGEFVFLEGTKPDVRLAQVAEAMAKEFNLDPEDAKLGTIHVVKELMLREFVFLIREKDSAGSAGKDAKRA
jgi:hypothetical protein